MSSIPKYQLFVGRPAAAWMYSRYVAKRIYDPRTLGLAAHPRSWKHIPAGCGMPWATHFALNSGVASTDSVSQVFCSFSTAYRGTVAISVPSGPTQRKTSASKPAAYPPHAVLAFLSDAPSKRKERRICGRQDAQQGS